MSKRFFLRPSSGVLDWRRAVSRRAAMRQVGARSMALSSHPHNQKDTLEGMYRWVDKCNSGSVEGLKPFRIAGSTVGFVETEVAKMLTSSVQEKVPPFALSQGGLTLSPHLSEASLEERTAAVAQAMSGLHDTGVIDGWRDELYPVASRFAEDPLLLVERAAAPLLGIKGYGVHMNGYVCTSDGMYLWVATRSASKPTWPSQLDHIAAGGQPHGLGVRENMVKEAAEEAGIPAHIASNAVAAGVVSYTSSYTYKSGVKGLKQDVLFVFDLELPEDFVPSAVDGEVEKFELVEVGEVIELVSKTDRYKDNCNLVLVDFFIRHGLLDPGAPGFLDLVAGVRRGPIA